MGLESIRKRITRAFNKKLGISRKDAKRLLPIKDSHGKLYEAYILAHVCGELKNKEGVSLKLSKGSKISFKQKGGPINRKYPYIEVIKSLKTIGEIHLDVEFMTLSSMNAVSPNERGYYHELDIAMFKPNLPNLARPKHDEVYLAIECKNTAMKKSYLREVLGLRRELSFLQTFTYSTIFQNWPKDELGVNPASCIFLYFSK